MTMGRGSHGGCLPSQAPAWPLTATVILPRIRSGMGPCIRFFSFSAHVPISSMAMKTSVCRGSSHNLGATIPHAHPRQALVPESGQGLWGMLGMWQGRLGKASRVGGD